MHGFSKMGKLKNVKQTHWKPPNPEHPQNTQTKPPDPSKMILRLPALKPHLLGVYPSKISTPWRKGPTRIHRQFLVNLHLLVNGRNREPHLAGCFIGSALMKSPSWTCCPRQPPATDVKPSASVTAKTEGTRRAASLSALIGDLFLSGKLRDSCPQLPALETRALSILARWLPALARRVAFPAAVHA